MLYYSNPQSIWHGLQGILIVVATKFASESAMELIAGAAALAGLVLTGDHNPH